ncbi:MAG: helix-turn-helix domain-containing protein [Firmicutes bacterium]|nr:helix-turn-helix domain-containing protein [Bacillota bacterium]
MKSSLDNLYEISMLMDFYGALLSQRQQDVMRLYHEENCSLQEIAEELGISRQGVHEALKKAENTLQGFEEKLGLVARFRKQDQLLEETAKALDALAAERSKDNGLKDSLLAIKQKIISLEE